MISYGLADFGLDLLKVGTSVALSSGLFKWFGKGWIDSHFQKQLQNLKHEQERALEQVRFDIQRTYSRVSKIHEREFDVLPKAWFLLHDLFGAVGGLTDHNSITFPNLDKMGQGQLHDLLAKSHLAEWEKVQLLQSPNKSDYYTLACRNNAIRKAQQALQDCHNFLITNSVFMDDVLEPLLVEAKNKLGAALIDYQDFFDYHDVSLRLKADEEMRSLVTLTQSISKQIQKRLHYDEA